MRLYTADVLKVGDLVKHPPVLRDDKDTIGLIIKKCFKTQKIKGEPHTSLSYDVLFPDGEIHSLKQKHLRIIQAIK